MGRFASVLLCAGPRATHRGDGDLPWRRTADETEPNLRRIYPHQPYPYGACGAAVRAVVFLYGLLADTASSGVGFFSEVKEKVTGLYWQSLYHE